MQRDVELSFRYLETKIIMISKTLKWRGSTFILRKWVNFLFFYLKSVKIKFIFLCRNFVKKSPPGY